MLSIGRAAVLWSYEDASAYCRISDRYPLLGPIIWMLCVQYFITQIVVASAWHTSFSLTRNVISDLGNTACGQYGDRFVCSPLHGLMNASFLLLGLTMATGSLLIYQEFQRNQPKYYAGTPVSLYIPSLNLRVQVIKGYYNQASHSWLLSGDKAQFATETTKLNNRSGLSLIYGHYNSHVFLSTDKLKLGALVEVTTDTHNIFTYNYVSSKVIAPTDTSLFAYQGEPRLALLTCTGTWYQNRHLMQFNLVSVRPAQS
jgi:LPXTG-site transpeptidase (sortase) family protein